MAIAPPLPCEAFEAKEEYSELRVEEASTHMAPPFPSLPAALFVNVEFETVTVDASTA